ncbi:MAG: hypothetical protein JO341_13960 [Gammaproteobacteria bacterium]|nr:hypothetical protein [Gammaproteobacteria bacterium]MBV9622109.1 hypothetical protein [Gammaproteobacteria bacterium]
MRILPAVLLILCGIAVAHDADPPPRPSSFAPHAKRPHGAYGAPVQGAILTHHRKKPRPAPRLKDLGPS